MVPGGWGQNPPTTAQIDAMAGWAQRHLDAAGGIIHDGEAGTDKLNTAIGNADVRAAKAACEDTTQPVTIRLPAVLPTPDPDVDGPLPRPVVSGLPDRPCAAGGVGADPGCDPIIYSVRRIAAAVGGISSRCATRSPRAGHGTNGRANSARGHRRDDAVAQDDIIDRRDRRSRRPENFDKSHGCAWVKNQTNRHGGWGGNRRDGRGYCDNIDGKKRRKATQAKAAANHARKVRVNKQAQDLINRHRVARGRPAKAVGTAKRPKRSRAMPSRGLCAN